MRPRRLVNWVVLSLPALLMVTVVPASIAWADACGPGSNPVQCENSKPGTPMSNWYSPNAYGQIQGFSSQESAVPGDTLHFKVSSPATYHVFIYRLGWYGGDGARLMPTSPADVLPAITQPDCLSDTTGLVDCGNWSVTASWTVPPDAVSGLYLAEFDQTDGAGLMPYPFVVRDDSRKSDVLVQTSDETWQAYNMYGGRNLYQGSGPAPDGRAYKVSYNRPLNIGGNNGVFGSEYAMLSWLERNGYDTSYISGLDVSTNAALLPGHKVFISSGHDEYWNQSQWDNVVAARASGLGLAFFSGNEVFWRTRLEPSIDGTNTASRTLVCYKMTKDYQYNPDGIADPTGAWTGTWMDAHGAGSGGNNPQNALTGTLFKVNGYRADAMTIPASYGSMRLWHNTSVATLPEGQVATFPTGTLGYEWDVDALNTNRPAGAIELSSTPMTISDGTLLLDDGNTYGNGSATHSLIEYRDQTSHALVFGAGTVQWAWGLSTVHVSPATSENADMEQATVNLLADMGAQPSTLQTGLLLAAPTTDTVGPSVSVASPAGGTTVPALSQVTISGTALDAGGVVARVEVSVDGGSTWRPATGTGSWSYSWTPSALGTVAIKVRAEDDSVNIGPVSTVTVTVGPQQCPCTVFPASAGPAKPDSGDASAVEVGAKFRTTTASSVTGIRFFKGSATNGGTHVGHLWTSTGTLLASGTFTNETASGWQTLTLANPIPVRANTTYLVSYFAPTGHYAADANYFTSQSAGLPPVQELQSGTDGNNGVYRYAANGGFPTSSFNSTNYWVDPIVTTSGTSTSPPTISATTPAAGATGVDITGAVTATFSQAIDSTTLQFKLTDSQGTVAPATASYDPATLRATLQPAGQLTVGMTYTASIQATDVWGNAMASPFTWTFTTDPTPPAVNCPCSIWGATATPAVANTSDTNSVEVGTRFSSAVGGYVTGVRFYKGTSNGGTHTGALWSASGTKLASGTFTNETASGWQTLTFASPVAITANTAYVVSYHAPTGRYSSDASYFAGPHTNYPLTGLADATGAANGVYKYNSGVVFPTSTFHSTNYWVDVVFTTTPPGGAAAKPALAHGPVPTGPVTSVTFPEPINPASLQITVESTTPAAEADEDTPVYGTVSYDATTRTARFTPADPLVPLARYRAEVHAVDLSGKALPEVVQEFVVPAPAPAPVQAPSAPQAPDQPLGLVALAASSPTRRTSAVPTGV